jgi:hypothetical protein
MESVGGRSAALSYVPPLFLLTAPVASPPIHLSRPPVRTTRLLRFPLGLPHGLIGFPLRLRIPIPCSSIC